jgi:putative transposase
MARKARIVVPGVEHHITQRGNNRQDVFFADDDRRVYLDILHEQACKYGFVVTGYCLMTNHVHIIGAPYREESLPKAVGRTHFLYTQYVNRLHKRSGHLWQNRFYSCALDARHAHHGLAYVELNPVRAGMVMAAEDWAWSSADAHLGGDKVHPCLELAAWREGMMPAVWRETLAAVAEDREAGDALCLHTRTGRPLGSDGFLRKVEAFLGRRVRPLPVGRQRGWRKQQGD